MRGTFLTLIFSILVAHFADAQSAFHRTYPSNRNKDIICISSIQTKDGNYLALELELEPGTTSPRKSDTILITSYKPKGDINWSKAIALDASFGGFNTALGSIIQGDKDSIYYSIISVATGKPSKIIGALDIGGNGGWMKSYTTQTNLSDGIPYSHLLTNFNKTIFSTNVGGTTAENDIALSRKNYSGDNIWSKLLSAKDISGKNVSEKVTHISFGIDSMLLLSGVVDTNNHASFLTVADSLGNVKWGKKYRTSNAVTAGKLYSYGAVRLPDSTYIMAGVLSRVSAKDKGFILKTKKNGDVEWGKTVMFKAEDNTIINHIALDKNNDIILSGVNTDTASYIFIIKIKKDGSLIWNKKYARVEGRTEFLGNLFGTADGGAALISGVKENNKLRPSFIKIDNSGSTTCEENITTQVLFDNPYFADTLIWTSVNAGSVTPITFMTKANSYEVPVLSLNVRPFCPNEPIDWTFKARTNGAVFYNWSTGEKGPAQDTIRVFKEGKFSVTVTIGEQVCYMLCDTAEITRYDKPKAALSLTLGNFCTNNKQTVSAGYMPGHPQVKSFAWNTGELNVANIEISQPGNYTVTVTDQCDEKVTASLNVGAFPNKITSASINGQVAIDCFGGNATGTLTATGNSSGLGVERYKWSSGQTTRAIPVNDTAVKTYTVTVTDGCGGSATSSFALEFKGPGVTKATISISKEGLCTTKTIRLNGLADRAGIFQYQWSNSATTPSINIDKAGTYTVTITDICGNKASGSTDVKESDLTPQDLAYANVFFPEGVGYRFQTGTDTLAYAALTLNRSFGPISKPEYCLNQVENYQFYVFNRWGQQVFESKNIQDEWNGKIGDKDSASDTYIWVVKYNIFGFEKKLKGDVTMIRQ